jgi:hypothetical protein
MNSQPTEKSISLSIAALSNAADALVHEYHRQLNNRSSIPPCTQATHTCRACCVTIIKLLDNILRHHTIDDDATGSNHAMFTKVRRLNLSNTIVQQTIVSYPGGIEFVYACGFTPVVVRRTTIGDDDPNHTLLLEEPNENIAHLIKARQLLQTICVYELRCPINELPLPPPIVSTQLSTVQMTPPTQSSNQAITTSAVTSAFPGGFNPYQGHRVDVGVPKGQVRNPPSNYQSPTEMELQRLATAQAKLEQQIQVPQLVTNREWTVHRMGASAPPPPPSSSSTTTVVVDTGTQPPGRGDGALLAARAQKMHMERQQRENSGFTTKAMRDVEQLKRTRVYTHVQLCIHVTIPNQNTTTSTVVQFSGKFLPRETIGQVMDALLRDCLLSSVVTRQDFELYITPPKRILSNWHHTLTQEGLVPAAKLFCRWTTPTTIKNWTSLADCIQPQWLNSMTPSANTVTATPNIAFPTSIPVVSAVAATVDSSSTTMNDDKDDKKKPAISKEDALLRRMMGGSSKCANSNKTKTVSDTKPTTGNSKNNPPKWFKG